RVDKIPDDELLTEWKPAIVGSEAAGLANILCSFDSCNAQEFGNADEFQKGANELCDPHIAGWDASQPGTVRLLTTNCGCVILPDGRFAVGEDSTGRL